MSRSRQGKVSAGRGGSSQRKPRAPPEPGPLVHPASHLASLTGNQATAGLLDSSAARDPTRGLGVGFPLPVALRQELEQAFGADLSAVRLHSGDAAEAAAEAEGAKAFTIGPDVVFSQGRYAPGTREGQRLLAHELTHVLQQRGGSTLSSPDRAEAEAGRAAELTGTGLVLPAVGSSPVGVQRAPEDDEKRIKKSKGSTKGKGEKKSGAKGAKGAAEAEPEIVGEYQGVPIKRYPPGPEPKAQKTYVTPPGEEELPEGTHQVTKNPPGSGKIRVETEGGIWAHNNYEQLKKILLDDAEGLTSEQLRPGLAKEETIPDTRLPPSSRPRMDRVDWENAEILEIKPKGLKKQGQAQADYYAEQMNKFAKRSDGKKWKGRCITYDDEKVLAFLKAKGYLEPAPAASGEEESKGKKGKGKRKGTAEAPAEERPKAAPKQKRPAKAVEKRQSPSVEKTEEPAVKSPVRVKASPQGESESPSKAGVSRSPRLKGSKGGTELPSQVRGRPTFRSRFSGAGETIVDAILLLAAELLLAKVFEKLDKAAFEKKLKALEPTIQAARQAAFDRFIASQDPEAELGPIWFEIQVRVTVTTTTVVAGVGSRHIVVGPNPELVSIKVANASREVPPVDTDETEVAPAGHAVIINKHRTLTTYFESIELVPQ